MRVSAISVYPAFYGSLKDASNIIQDGLCRYRRPLKEARSIFLSSTGNSIADVVLVATTLELSVLHT